MLGDLDVDTKVSLSTPTPTPFFAIYLTIAVLVSYGRSYMAAIFFVATCGRRFVDQLLLTVP